MSNISKQIVFLTKRLLFEVLNIGKYSSILHMGQKDPPDWSHAELRSPTLFRYLGVQLLQWHPIVATWIPSVGISCRHNWRPTIDHGTLKFQSGLVSHMNERNASNICVVNNNNAVHIYTLYNITISPVYSDYCLSFRLRINMIGYWINIIIQWIIRSGDIITVSKLMREGKCGIKCFIVWNDNSKLPQFYNLKFH